MKKEDKFMLAAITMIGFAILILCSIHIWGPDNEVEEESEEIVIEIIEEDLLSPLYFIERKNAVNAAPYKET